MTIGEDEQVIIKTRPTSISSIYSSSDGESIYEDARDYFEDIKEEYRKEYELGGTSKCFIDATLKIFRGFLGVQLISSI